MHKVFNGPFCYLLEQGQSWSIGMDSNAPTVANFLKFYSSSIIGGSLRHHIGDVYTWYIQILYACHTDSHYFLVISSIISGIMPTPYL